VKNLANPVLLRAAVVFFCSAFAFVLALVLMRLLRKSITEDAEISSEGTPSFETMPLHVFNTVIQQLKQQKHELQVQSEAEQRRLRTTENFSQAVLSNLSCGVLVFGTNGLVKTANPAAKAILGFASPTGMGAEDIFRGALVSSGVQTTSTGSEDNGDEAVGMADKIREVLQEESKRCNVEAEYETPAGAKRFIAVTISPVPSVDGSLLGAACLINDMSELEQIRRQQQLDGEISAEKALQLRTSLATISSCVQQLVSSRDAETAQRLAADIAHEAAELDRSIGGFLTKTQAMQGAAAGSGAN
jgi:PAS domain-containing protein